jgi:CBS domain-containing protein
VLVRDLMVPVLASVGLATPVSRAARQLMELNLDSLPVVDAAGKVTGFVTEQDVMTAVLDARGADQPIANCNHVSVPIFEETVAAEEIATFFSRSAVQRVVIVRHGSPVGLVSRRTLLRWLLNYSLEQQSAQRGSAQRPSAFAESAFAESAFAPAAHPPSAYPQSAAGALACGGLDESIRELAAAVSRLTKLDAAGCDELLSSSVVSEATRIQQSVENLLTHCRPRRTNSPTPELLTTGALSIA